MALNAQCGTVTQPGSIGSQSTSLPADFDPKALIVWTTARTAGGGSAHGQFSYGFATDRGGTPVQRYVSFNSEDNIGTSDVYPVAGSADIIKITNGTTSAVDLEVAFVEFVSGASSAFVLDWQNLHTTASILLNYVVLGGDGVEDALVSSLTLGASPQDVTVVSGFGQPSLIFFILSWHGGDTPAAANGDTCIGFGIKSGSANGRNLRFGSQTAATTQATNQAINNNNAISLGNNAAIESTMTVAGSGGWPVNGFEITNTGSTGFPVQYLAIRFATDVTVTAGQGAAPTSGGLPVVQSITCADEPKIAMFYNLRTTTANTVDTTSTDCMFMGVGAIDTAEHEVWAGMSDDDAQATASVCGTAQSVTKSLTFYDSASNTKTSEADGQVNGSNFELSWNDIDTGAYLYEWLTIGGPSAVTDIFFNAVVASATATANVPTLDVFVDGALASATATANIPTLKLRELVVFASATATSNPPANLRLIETFLPAIATAVSNPPTLRARASTVFASATASAQVPEIDVKVLTVFASAIATANIPLLFDDVIIFAVEAVATAVSNVPTLRVADLATFASATAIASIPALRASILQAFASAAAVGNIPVPRTRVNTVQSSAMGIAQVPTLRERVNAVGGIATAIGNPPTGRLTANSVQASSTGTSNTPFSQRILVNAPTAIATAAAMNPVFFDPDAPIYRSGHGSKMPSVRQQGEEEVGRMK